MRASDIVGNQDATPAAYTWLVDGTNPTGSVTVTGRRSRHRRHGLADEQLGRRRQRRRDRHVPELPGGRPNTWTNQAASWNTTVELDGDYDLRVVTTDNAGNSFASAPITVTVDNTVPTALGQRGEPGQRGDGRSDTAGRDRDGRG